MLQYIHLIVLKVALFLKCGACGEKPYQARIRCGCRQHPFTVPRYEKDLSELMIPRNGGYGTLGTSLSLGLRFPNCTRGRGAFANPTLLHHCKIVSPGGISPDTGGHSVLRVISPSQKEKNQ